MSTSTTRNWVGGSLSRSADFRLIVAGRIASTMASAMTWVLLPLYVYETTGSASAASLMSAMNVLPFLVFGLFAGIVVDRLPPRTVMIVVELVNGLVMLLVPLVVATVGLSYPVALAIGALTSTVFVLFEVASSALVPAIAGPKRIFQANGHIWTASTVVNALAAPLGFFLLGKLGLGPTFAVLAGAYALSSALACWMQAGRRKSDDNDGPGSMAWAEVIKGVSFIRSERVVGVLTLVGFGIGLSGGAVYTIIVVFANTALGLDTDDYRVAWIIAASSLGALGASFLAPRLRRYDPLDVTLIVLTFDALLMLGYAWSPTWIAAAILIGCWNFAHTVAMIISISVRQQRCPPELQGRVNAVGRMLAWGAIPLGGGLCGLLIDTTGAASASMTIMAAPVSAAIILLIVVRTISSRASGAGPS